MVGDDGFVSSDEVKDALAKGMHATFNPIVEGPIERLEARDNVHPLKEVFADVLDQVRFGKGERHGGDAKPFWTQNWASVASSHGLGFLTGQAQKKLVEAMESGHLTANPEAFERELCGAIAYLGMALLQYRKDRSA